MLFVFFLSFNFLIDSFFNFILQYWIGCEINCMIYFCLLAIVFSLSQINVYCSVGVQFCEHLFLSYNKIKKVIKPNRVHDSSRGVTRFDLICRCLNIIFKSYHLEVFLKLSFVFIGHSGCIWTYEIDRFKLNQIPYDLIRNFFYILNFFISIHTQANKLIIY